MLVYDLIAVPLTPFPPPPLHISFIQKGRKEAGLLTLWARLSRHAVIPRLGLTYAGPTRFAAARRTRGAAAGVRGPLGYNYP